MSSKILVHFNPYKNISSEQRLSHPKLLKERITGFARSLILLIFTLFNLTNFQRGMEEDGRDVVRSKRPGKGGVGQPAKKVI